MRKTDLSDMQSPLPEPEGGDFHDGFLDGNGVIEDAIDRYCENENGETLIAVLKAIARRARSNGHFLLPVVSPDGASDASGCPQTAGEGAEFFMQTYSTEDGRQWLAAFTSREEYEKGKKGAVLSYFIDEILVFGRDMTGGILLNPGGKTFFLSKEMLQALTDAPGKTESNRRSGK